MEQFLGKENTELVSFLVFLYLCTYKFTGRSDWFAHDGVLERLAVEYRKENIWMTYGQFKEYPGDGLGCSRQIPSHIKESGRYRRYRWCSSHLRTYYAWLFKEIKKEDLMINGEFLPMSSDLAAMFPMLEMSGINHTFISDILYIYNCETPLNDAKVDLKCQQGLEFRIRAMKPYQRVDRDKVKI